MSATAKNPNFPGALSLAEVVPGMNVLVVSIREREYFNATVTSVNVDTNDIDLRYNFAKVGSMTSNANALGVVPGVEGEWMEYCLTETDNPALEGFVDYETGTVNDSRSRSKTLTSASWFFDNLQ